MFSKNNCITKELFNMLRNKFEKENTNNSAQNTQSCLSNSNNIQFGFEEDSYFVAKNSGIQNKGNTCYIASTLQCLNVLTPFLKYLIENFVEHEVFYKYGKRHSLFKAYIEWLYKGLNRKKRPLTQEQSDRLRDQFFIELNNENNHLKEFKSPGQQQDADEFLIKFLDYIDNCLNEVHFIRNAKIDQSKPLDIQYDEYQSNTDDHSVSGMFFGFNIQERFKCLQNVSHSEMCRLENRKETRLNLEIEGLKTLEESLRSFCNSNLVKYCRQCDKDVEFSNIRYIDQLSDYLIIGLKRFKFDCNLGRTIKLCDFLSFPIKLNIGEFLRFKEESLIYLLKGIVLHHGTYINKGHYSALVWSERDQTWLHKNDEKSFEIQNIYKFLNEFKNDFQPYLLFYTKEDFSSNNYSFMLEKLLEEEKGNKENLNATIDLTSDNDRTELDIDEDLNDGNEAFCINRDVSMNSIQTYVAGDKRKANKYDEISCLSSNSDILIETIDAIDRYDNSFSNMINENNNEKTSETNEEIPNSNKTITETKDKRSDNFLTPSENSSKKGRPSKRTKQTPEERKEKNRLNMQQRRLNNEDLRARETQNKRNYRAFSENRGNERERDRERRSESRGNEVRRNKEKEQDRLSKIETRKNDALRELEKLEDRLRKFEKRKDNDYREAERILDRVRKADRRLDDNYHDFDREQNTIWRAERRLDESFRSLEREQDSIKRASRRLDVDFRENEREQDALKRTEKRKNLFYKETERLLDKIRKSKRRNDVNFREQEREQDKIRRREHRNLQSTIIKNYEDGILKGPNTICVSCGCLFFERSTKSLPEKNSKNESIYEQTYFLRGDEFKKNGKAYLCTTCFRHLSSGKMPSLCLSNGFNYETLHPSLSVLNNLEERLVSPRIPFMCIKDLLTWDGQKKLVGNVVNVPIDNVEMLKDSLPRKFDQSYTVQLNLMRRSDYKRAYISDFIRPFNVIEACNYLSTLPLYKEINFDQNWIEQFQNLETNEQIPFVLNREEDQQNVNEIIEIDRNRMLNNYLDNLEENTELENSLENIQNTNENEEVDAPTMLINHNEIAIQVAPGEGIMPKPLLSDKIAEELSFPKIYNGKEFKSSIPNITYAARCKSEFRRYDRRAAKSHEKIFYSTRKLQMKKLSSAIDIALKKIKDNEYENVLTVRDALDKTHMSNLLIRQEANLLLRSIRSSPQYWEWKKMEINAMIRQIGCPTFFITLSPQEIEWNELIVILVFALEQREISLDEAKIMDREKKIELVRNDPITVARYFESRMNEMLKYIFHPNGPFQENKVLDYFWRIEFQSRGSPHIHMITWNENAPNYDPLSNKEEKEENKRKCIELINKYITCERPDNEEGIVYEDDYENRQEGVDLKKYPIKYQEHVCRFNCKIKIKNKNQNKNENEKENDNNNSIIEIVDDQGKDLGQENDEFYCKYNFPWPILNETVILEPLDKEKEKNFKNLQLEYFKLRRILLIIHNDWKENKVETSLDDLLQIMKLSYDEYLKVLSSSITRTTVFLRRTCKELMINAYNRDIMDRHRANCDIQFITDPYGAVAYLTAYMLKGNATMSQLIRRAIERMNDGDRPTRQRFLSVANKFTNCSEIGAQECAYTLLSMPLSRMSRESVFVNTYPRQDRNHLLKEDRFLQLMSPDSEDVFRLSLLDHYVKRPKSERFNKMCLAEFASMFEYFSNFRRNKEKNPNKVSRFEHDDVDEKDDDQNEEDFNRDENLAHLTENGRPIEPTTSQQEIDENTEQVNVNSQVTNNEQDEKGYIQLRHKHGWIKKRNKAKILRYKRYNKKKERDEYWRVQRMLFLPWLDEEKEIENENNKDFIRNNMEEFVNNKKKWENIDGDTFEKIQEDVHRQLNEYYEDLQEEEAARLEEANQYLMNRNQQINLPSENSQTNRNEEFEDECGFHAQLEEITNLLAAGDEKQNEKCTFPAKMPNDQYNNLMTSLNRQQHKYMMNFLTAIRSEKPFYHNIQGPAGTGKSHLINAIYQTFLRHIYPSIDDDQDSKEIVCILGAFTGKAAFNIGGSTLHSLLRIPVSAGPNANIMGSKTVEAVRKYLKDLKLMIIDEISMVSRSLLTNLSNRLIQVTGVDLPFGGLSVICVGDFNQLRPVLQQPIFRNVKEKIESYESISSSVLWDMFRLFELTEIMRQGPEQLKFTNALNKIGNYDTYVLTQEEVDMFDKQYVNDLSEIPMNAIVLCYENENVNKFNQSRILEKERMDGEKAIECLSVDYGTGKGKDSSGCQNMIKELKKTNDIYQSSGLPSKILLKKGIKYMITYNIDLSDGLVNGAVGTLVDYKRNKNFVNDKETPNELKLKRLYLRFDDAKIGQKARQKRSKKHDEIVKQNCYLVPIDFEDKKIDYAPGYCVMRKQFPIIESEAMTIHKSQGQTYDSICVHMGQHGLERSLLYVALSRVRTLDGLKLYKEKDSNGLVKRTILREAVSKIPIEKRIEAGRKVNENNSILHEMNRLRECSLMINVYKFLDIDSKQIEKELKDSKYSKLRVLFLNIQDFGSNYARIRNEWAFRNADLIFLVECHNFKTNKSDAERLFMSDQMASHSMIYFSSCPSQNSSNGQIVYVRQNKHKPRLNFVKDNSDANSFVYRESLKLVELSLFKYVYESGINKKEIYIVCVYKHPSLGKQEFKQQFLDFLKKNLGANYLCYNILVIGDFNYDFNKSINASMLEFIEQIGFKRLLKNTVTFEKFKSQPDSVLTSQTFNFKIDNICAYRTYFSDHHAIWMEINFNEKI